MFCCCLRAQALAVALQSPSNQPCRWDLHGGIEDAYCFPPGSVRGDDLTMDVAKTLLQIATPETVLSASEGLPDALLRGYIEDQEHFDFRQIVLRGDDGDDVDVAQGDLASAVNTCMLRCVRVCGRVCECTCVGVRASVFLLCL